MLSSVFAFCGLCSWFDVLDELLSLDVVHAVDTRNTVTRHPKSAPLIPFDGRCSGRCVRAGVPDGENTSGLGKTGLFLDSTDPLFEDGGHLGRRGLRVGRIAANSAVVERCRCAGLKFRQHSAQRELPWNQRGSPNPSTKLQCGANGIENRVQEPAAMARWTAGAIAAGDDGLTEAIWARADTAARRLDWRRARENIVDTSRGY